MGGSVSILVFLELALEVAIGKEEFWPGDVSILVFLELALEAHRKYPVVPAG